jgi:hypothetical protein
MYLFPGFGSSSTGFQADLNAKFKILENKTAFSKNTLETTNKIGFFEEISFSVLSRIAKYLWKNTQWYEKFG